LPDAWEFLTVCILSFAASAASVVSQAETYDGVHPGASQLARGTVNQDAVQIARSGNVYGDVAASGVAATPVATASRAEVRREAAATSRLSDPYGEAASAGSVSDLFAAQGGRTFSAKAFSSTSGN
jgi:hypothetical protein